MMPALGGGDQCDWRLGTEAVWAGFDGTLEATLGHKGAVVQDGLQDGPSGNDVGREHGRHSLAASEERPARARGPSAEVAGVLPFRTC